MMTEKPGARQLHARLQRNTEIETFIDFLNGSRSTEVYNFLYHDILDETETKQSEGTESWEQAISRKSHYYIFPNEVELIGRVAAEIADLIPYRSTLMELGVGSNLPVEKKTLPMIYALKPQRYIANDLTRKVVTDAQQLLNERIPWLKVEPCPCDFLNEKAPLYAYADANVIMMGSTISNIKSYDGGVPVNEVVAYLETISRLIGVTGSLIMTQDANQDEASLLEAYNTPIIRRLLESMLLRIKTYFESVSLDITVMKYEPVWDAKSHLLAVTFVNVVDQTVQVAGRSIHLPEGKRLYLANCYKYPVPSFLHMARIAGLVPVKTWMDRDNRVALHVLRKKSAGK